MSVIERKKPLPTPVTRPIQDSYDRRNDMDKKHPIKPKKPE